MTDAIDKLAEVIGKNISQSPRGIGYAVLAALPDLVTPLRWMKAPDWMDSDICTTCGVYKISDHDILWLPNDETGQEYDTPEAAKSAANAHHIAQIMQAFGVEP